MPVDLLAAHEADDPPATLRCPDCAAELLALGQAWRCGTCRHMGLVACCRWCLVTAWIPGGQLGTLPPGWARLAAGNRVETVCSSPHAAGLLDLLANAGVITTAPPLAARRTEPTS
jgi:hypothetical protein